MEAIKYRLNKTALIMDGSTISCGMKTNTTCGIFCAMFELRHTERGNDQAILHCCKRVITFEPEVKE